MEAAIVTKLIPVTCERTLDVGYCIDIITEPTIYDAISEDEAKIEDLVIDVINHLWVKVSVGDLDIGVVQFKPMFNHCYDADIHILPEFRQFHSMQAGEMIWNWVESNLKDSLIHTNVPVFCENVRNFLLQFEFKESGILEKAWLKNGKLNDMWILTRRTK